ncbi:hypothetical protein LT330_000494 [Penicillium expansum]|uniref:Uncharacterized protein n=1 Tax=Penicillium expansum TaxID=27334 RepID=A0A0A2IGM3_PENEN|nr:hypothetical protein PEX2_078230 [Penicillium expansum]KAK4871257.1 hypothetical protein LT330_000494 [Penicillium expansum]KGO42174.1 hypothetical protein PEXP_051240 [Penicillium expansum]KGO56216.1 hypothetical protein PEX2_078230 [Penicillium expansum]KGO65208.1 hypothetical protein PEX1_098070 [Penicillium expansum]
MRSIGLLGDVPTTSVFSMMPAGLPSSFSPKRKREPSESDCYSRSASPTSTASNDSFQEVPLQDEDELESYSPRTAVTGRFGELAIRSDLVLDSGTLTGNPRRGSLALPAQKACEPDSHELKNMPEALPATSSESNDRQALRFEPPATQDPTPLPNSPSKKKSATFSRKNLNPSSPSKRKQRLSPPLADTPSEEDPLVWHDSEITGHNPSDPTDDGYGINGIGFKPTASIAWERSQKRQKQVAEWKNREAREARERRRERRRDGVELDNLHGMNEGAIQKRVKFNF